MSHLHALSIRYSFAHRAWNFLWLLGTPQAILRTVGSTVELTLPGSIAPPIDDEIWWVNTPDPLPFACSHSEVFALYGSRQVSRGIEPQLPTVEAGLIISALSSAIPVSFHQFSSSVFWDHLPNKILALDSLSQCLLLGEPNQSQWWRKEQS